MFTAVTAPRVAVGPGNSTATAAAIRAAGGLPVAADAPADALVWLAPFDPHGLQAAVKATGALWVQLPSAGVEPFADASVLDRDRIWTCAKGAYAEPVAEHALMLALAGLRSLNARIPARSWGEPAAISLYDAPVTIVGGGGVATCLLQLLAPFRATATVVRRSSRPVPGAARTLPVQRLPDALPDAQVVFLALALTPQTERIIGAAELAAMRSDSWLVNVARGRHVDTRALIAALDTDAISGAALDVTDPEPLPDGHPLWAHERCIITPHTADTREMTAALLARRVRINVARFAAGEQLLGLVDPVAGY